MKGLVLQLLSFFVSAAVSLVTDFTPIICEDELICALLLSSSTCELLTEVERCPVSCKLCDPEVFSTQAITKLPEMTPPIDFYDDGDKPPVSDCCPKDCVDRAVLNEWGRNYLFWLDDYQKWKEEFLRLKELADSGRLCSIP